MSENGLLITLGEDSPIYHDLDKLPPELEPPFDFAAALLHLEQERQRINARNAIAEQMSERFYEMYVQPYEDEIEANKKLLQDLEAQIIAEARKGALENGDFAPHPSIEVKRKPKTWNYDDKQTLEVIQTKANDETLDEAQRLAIRELLRVKTELNKHALNAALKDNRYPWLPATPAPVNVIITIRKLGDLTIKAEAEGDPES